MYIPYIMNYICVVFMHEVLHTHTHPTSLIMSSFYTWINWRHRLKKMYLKSHSSGSLTLTSLMLRRLWTGAHTHQVHTQPHLHPSQCYRKIRTQETGYVPSSPPILASSRRLFALTAASQLQRLLSKPASSPPSWSLRTLHTTSCLLFLFCQYFSAHHFI